jgi:hypothetical protein
MPGMQPSQPPAGNNMDMTGMSPAEMADTTICATCKSRAAWHDPHFRNGDYDKWTAYGQSKTANSLFAVGFHQR